MKVNYWLQYIVVLFIFSTPNLLLAQDDLMDLLDKETTTKEKSVSATFKGTRIILGHSIETKKKGELEFLVSHRFGAVTGGAHELWGLDGASVRLGFNYGITDNLTVGLGRGSFDKSYDFFTKIKALKQPKRVVRDIAQDDLMKLFSTDLYEDNIIGIRDRLMLELFYLTGIRRAEIINLCESDLEL